MAEPTLTETVTKLIQAYIGGPGKLGGLRGLAEKTGISYDSVQKYARGANRPPPEKLRALLAVIDPETKILQSSPLLFEGHTESLPEPTMKSTKDENVKTSEQGDESQEAHQITKSQDTEMSVDGLESEISAGKPERQKLQSFISAHPYSDDTYDDNEFFIPIHGFVRFSDREMDVINHPAFQRLGEIYQLGQSYLVYRGATHKRMEHVLGAVHVVQEVIDAVAENHSRLERSGVQSEGSPLCDTLSTIERAFTRLGALLHDIGHLPAGHTLEDELQLIPKHDEVKRLNLVLDRISWPGVAVPPLRSVINEHYKHFLQNSKLTPAELMIQIVAKDPPEVKDLPKDFRIEVCKDIVGNTICADLLDYLHRDWYHIGKPKYYDKRLFQYMEIRGDSEGKPQFVISLGRKSRLKTDAISAILDLLESRYQLAESVLFHRTKCSAAAMLERATQELAAGLDGAQRKLWIEALEERLLDYSDLGLLKTFLAEAETNGCEAAERCLSSLRNRRIYKTIYTTFHGERLASVPRRLQQMYSTSPEAPENRLAAVRLLEEDFDLPAGTVAMYCPSRGMNAKIAEVSIHMDGVIDTFKEWDKDEVTLGGGHLGAQLLRFTRLWRVHISLHREEWDRMTLPKRHLFYRAAKELVLGINDFATEKAAYDLALAASMTPGTRYHNKPVKERDIAARREKIATYPTGAPSLKAFFPPKS